jgi:hypothetical protein
MLTLLNQMILQRHSLTHDTLSKNSSVNNHSDKFKVHKRYAEQNRLRFNSTNWEVYNSPCCPLELQEALSKCHNSAVGPDDIHYQMLKHLPETSIEALLAI